VRLEQSLVGEHAALSHRSDGTLHPNAAGHLAIARLVAPKLAVTLGLTEPTGGPQAPTQSWWARKWQTVVLGVVLGLIALATFITVIPPVRRWAGRIAALLGSGHQPDPVHEPAADDAPRAGTTGLRPGVPGPAAVAPAIAGVLRLALAFVGFLLCAALALGASFLVGAAIVWVRFWSARFPADQAAQSVGRAEVAAIGAQALAPSSCSARRPRWGCGSSIVKVPPGDRHAGASRSS
jgi:hypothetical protein